MDMVFLANSKCIWKEIWTKETLLVNESHRTELKAITYEAT